MSLLPARLMKIRFKMKSLSSGRHFPKPMGPSSAGNSHANKATVRNFMPVLVIFKFDEDLIKMKSLSPRQHLFFSIILVCLCETKGQVTLMLIVWPKTEHVQDFMTVLIICKSGEDLIKNEVAVVRTTFS